MMRMSSLLVATAAMFGVGAVRAHPPAAPRARIQVLSSPNTDVRVFNSAPTRLSVGGGPMAIHGDTIRARTPLRLEAYLDAGDIHVEAAGSVPIEVTATLTDAPALRLSGSGHRVVLKKGRSEIQVP